PQGAPGNAPRPRWIHPSSHRPILAHAPRGSKRRRRPLDRGCAGKIHRIDHYQFDNHRIDNYRRAMSDATTDQAPMPALVRLFKGLADPTRLRLIGAMVDRPRCGQDLAAEVGVTPATVSHHLRVLTDAGLLRETRQPPYTFYQVDLAQLQGAIKA